MEEQQPGHVVAPGAGSPPSETSQRAPVQAAAGQSEPVAADSPLPAHAQPQPAEPALSHSEPAAQQKPVAGAQTARPGVSEASGADYAAQEASVDALQQDGTTLTWSISESVHPEKTAGWYSTYVLGTILIGVVVYLTMRDVFSVVVVLLAICGLMYAIGRKVREQQCELGEDFVRIDKKTYPLHNFKAFSVDVTASTHSVELLPLKRLMPTVVLFVDEAHEKAVIDHLSARLPKEEHKIDAVDSLVRRMGF